MGFLICRNLEKGFICAKLPILLIPAIGINNIHTKFNIKIFDKVKIKHIILIIVLTK